EERPRGRCRRRGCRTARSPTASRTAETRPGCVTPNSSSSHPHHPHVARPATGAVSLRLVVAPVVSGRSGLPLLALLLGLLCPAAFLRRLAGERRQLVAHDVAQGRRRHAAGETLRVRQLLGARGAAERQP